MNLSLISPIKGMALTDPSARLLKKEMFVGMCFPGSPYTI